MLASIVASLGYFLLSDQLPGLFVMALKGAGVGLLAIYAARRSSGIDGALIASVLAVAALADIVLEISFLIGAGLFALSHLVAIALYWRNRRKTLRASQKQTAIAILLLVPAIAALSAWPQANWQLATLYAATIAAMSASAWISRFPRYRVGMGTLLFVASDLMIIAREAGRFDPTAADWMVWPLYYIGQLMIATGVVQALRNEVAKGLHR
ncbi:lysoplasmalogenase [Qipengyuania pelagi]